MTGGRPNNVPRHGDSTLRAGPTNVIWLIACDYVNPSRIGPSTPGAWWRYASASTPPAAVSSSQIWRMNGVRTRYVTDGAGHVTRGRRRHPVARLDTLATAIRDSYVVDAPDMVFYWHGTHVNVIGDQAQHAASEETPIQLAHYDEEYFGNLHTERRPGAMPPPRPDNLQIDASRRWSRSADAVQYDDILRRRREFSGSLFMFNWSDDDRLGNTHYTNVVAAMRGHPHVKRFHLLGCDLADLRYMKPIWDLAEDIRTGRRDQTPGVPSSRVTSSNVDDREVWVYNDFTQTELSGAYLYISHAHEGGDASYGVKQTAADTYERVVLFRERGVLEGWQVRGLVVNGETVVEQFTRDGLGDFVVKRINGQNIGASYATVPSFPVPVPGSSGGLVL